MRGHLEAPADLDSGAEDTNLVRSAEASGPLGLGAEGHVKLDN